MTSSSSSPTLPINQRKWNDTPDVRRMDDNSCKISKLMTRLLRHQCYPREDDEAIEWRKWLPMFYRDFPAVKTWTKQALLNHSEKGSDKKRLQYCSDSYEYTLYTSEGTKFIHLCRTQWKSRTSGLIEFITLVLPMSAILFLDQV